MPLGPKSKLVEMLIEKSSSTDLVEIITNATRNPKAKNTGEIEIDNKQYIVRQMPLLTPSQAIRKYPRNWLKK
jgi:hypothetical protein